MLKINQPLLGLKIIFKITNFVYEVDVYDVQLKPDLRLGFLNLG